MEQSTDIQAPKRVHMASAATGGPEAVPQGPIHGDADAVSISSTLWAQANRSDPDFTKSKHLDDDKAIVSDWLNEHQRRRRRHRRIFGVIGFIIFVALIGGIIFWVSTDLLAPKKKYTANLSQVPSPSHYVFSRATRSMIHTSTMTSSSPKSTQSRLYHV
ncbi:hypothetical protein BC940DRAFT_137183 [Gongronella butleri]|nr:hypothetical protein BC940DRAFT_137183 [Gongronella butleri]